MALFRSGKTAAKKAQRIAGQLRRQREFMERRQMLREFRQVQSQVALGGSLSGAGEESSGLQGVQGSVATQGVANFEYARLVGRQTRLMQSHQRRAQKNARRFATTMKVASAVAMVAAPAAGAALAGLASTGTGLIAAAGNALGTTGLTAGVAATGQILGGAAINAAAPEQVDVSGTMAPIPQIDISQYQPTSLQTRPINSGQVPPASQGSSVKQNVNSSVFNIG